MSHKLRDKIVRDTVYKLANEHGTGSIIKAALDEYAEGFKAELRELQDDFQESERSNKAWDKIAIDLAPFDLPTSHHAAEYLYEWRKRWDALEAKLIVVQRPVDDEFACSACGGSGLVTDEAARMADDD